MYRLNVFNQLIHGHLKFDLTGAIVLIGCIIGPFDMLRDE